MSRHNLGIDLCFQLSALIAACEIRALNELSDLPKECEDYIIPLLCWLYGMRDGRRDHEGLFNANEEKANQSGYDLKCNTADKRAWIQVTTQHGNERAKIKSALLKSLNNEQAEADTMPLYVLFLKTEMKTSAGSELDPLSDYQEEIPYVEFIRKNDIPNGQKKESYQIVIENLGAGKKESETEGGESKAKKNGSDDASLWQQLETPKKVYILDAAELYKRILKRLPHESAEGETLATQNAAFPLTSEQEGKAEGILAELKDITGLKECPPELRSMMTPVEQAKQDVEQMLTKLMCDYLGQRGEGKANVVFYANALSQFLAVAKRNPKRTRGFANELSECTSAPTSSGIPRAFCYDPQSVQYMRCALNQADPNDPDDDGMVTLKYKLESNETCDDPILDAYALLADIICTFDPDLLGNSKSYRDMVLLERIGEFIKEGRPECLYPSES